MVWLLLFVCWVLVGIGCHVYLTLKDHGEYMVRDLHEGSLFAIMGCIVPLFWLLDCGARYIIKHGDKVIFKLKKEDDI